MGEITTKGYVDIQKIVRIPFERLVMTSQIGFDANTCGVIVALDGNQESP